MGRETINAEVKFYFYKRFSWVKVIQSVNYSLPPAYLEISGGGRFCFGKIIQEGSLWPPN